MSVSTPPVLWDRHRHVRGGSTLRASLSGTFLPNSARFGYATEVALFISVHLSSDAVRALRKVQPKHARKEETHPPRVKKKKKKKRSSVSIQTIVVLFVLV